MRTMCVEEELLFADPLTGQGRVQSGRVRASGTDDR